MEWFGDKNPQLLKAGGTLAEILDNARQIQEPNATNDKFYLC